MPSDPRGSRRTLTLDPGVDGAAASDEAFAITGTPTAEPERVRDFVDAHPELSREGRRMALARLASGPYRRR